MMSNLPLTRTQLRALRMAYARLQQTGHAFICPIIGVHDAAETAVLNALRRRGLATTDPSPVATDEGLRVAVRLD